MLGPCLLVFSVCYLRHLLPPNPLRLGHMVVPVCFHLIVKWSRAVSEARGAGVGVGGSL